MGQGGQHWTLLAPSEGTEPLPRKASVPHVRAARHNRAHRVIPPLSLPCESGELNTSTQRCHLRYTHPLQVHS